MRRTSPYSHSVARRGLLQYIDETGSHPSQRSKPSPPRQPVQLTFQPMGRPIPRYESVSDAQRPEAMTTVVDAREPSLSRQAGELARRVLTKRQTGPAPAPDCSTCRPIRP